MPYDLSNVLVVGISSRALFDLEEENALFERDGVDAFINYQLAHIDEAPGPGTGFRLIQNLMSLNVEGQPRRVEVIILSRNNAITSLRITKAIEHYGLDIARSAWTGGASQANYLGAYKVDLFLSAHEEDVQAAINAGFAAARIYGPPQQTEHKRHDKSIRIAFDGDAVLFSAESERIYQESGLEAFVQHERENASRPLPDGPFAPLLRTIAKIQAGFGLSEVPIRTALITARNSSAHERVIRTLHEWNVRIDEVHFLGGISKHEVLAAFGADIFFDDQDAHCVPASQVVPTAIVPQQSDDLDSYVISNENQRKSQK